MRTPAGWEEVEPWLCDPGTQPREVRFDDQTFVLDKNWTAAVAFHRELRDLRERLRFVQGLDWGRDLPEIKNRAPELLRHLDGLDGHCGQIVRGALVEYLERWNDTLLSLRYTTWGCDEDAAGQIGQQLGRSNYEDLPPFVNQLHALTKLSIRIDEPDDELEQAHALLEHLSESQVIDAWSAHAREVNGALRSVSQSKSEKTFIDRAKERRTKVLELSIWLDDPESNLPRTPRLLSAIDTLARMPARIVGEQLAGLFEEDLATWRKRDEAEFAEEWIERAVLPDDAPRNPHRALAEAEETLGEILDELDQRLGGTSARYTLPEEAERLHNDAKRAREIIAAWTEAKDDVFLQFRVNLSELSQLTDRVVFSNNKTFADPATRSDPTYDHILNAEKPVTLHLFGGSALTVAIPLAAKDAAGRSKRATFTMPKTGVDAGALSPFGWIEYLQQQTGIFTEGDDEPRAMRIEFEEVPGKALILNQFRLVDADGEPIENALELFTGDLKP